MSHVSQTTSRPSPPIATNASFHPLSLPSPPLTPGTRLDAHPAPPVPSKGGARRPSFSFASPFTFLPGKRINKQKKREDGEAAVAAEQARDRDEDVARRKRLPSGHVILIKGPYPHTDYPPYSSTPDEVPSLPPLPPNLAHLIKSGPLPKYTNVTHARSPSDSRGSRSASRRQSAVSPIPSELLLSTSLPDERSLLATSPDFSPFSLHLSLPRSRSASLVSSPSSPISDTLSSPGSTVGPRTPMTGPARSPPARPPPPPPHLGLGTLPRFRPGRGMSKSNPNTPIREEVDPFAALSQALANRPPMPEMKGPALRAAASANAGRQSISSDAGEAARLVKVPSMVLKETPPLKIPEKVKGRRSTEQGSARRSEPGRSGSAGNATAREERRSTESDAARRERLRSVHGLQFPNPPLPALPSAPVPTTTPDVFSPQPQPHVPAPLPILEDSPIIVPDLPRTPPMRSLPFDSPPSSPTGGLVKTLKSPRSGHLPRTGFTTKQAHQQHQRRRSATLSSPDGVPGSPTKGASSAPGPLLPPIPSSPAQTGTSGSLESSPVVDAHPQTQPQSPTLTLREYALAHANAHNQAQAHAMRMSGSPPVSPQKRAGEGGKPRAELEEENRFLKEALKAHRDKLHLLMPPDGVVGVAVGGRGRPATPPRSPQASGGIKPLHLAGGPPLVPLPPTPTPTASPVSPKQPHPLVRNYPSDASLSSLTSMSSVGSVTTSTLMTPLPPPSSSSSSAPLARPQTGVLRTEIASLQSELARAKGEIEVYRRENEVYRRLVPPVPVPPVPVHVRERQESGKGMGMGKKGGEELKKAMKRSRSEPMLGGSPRAEDEEEEEESGGGEGVGEGGGGEGDQGVGEAR